MIATENSAKVEKEKLLKTEPASDAKPSTNCRGSSTHGWKVRMDHEFPEKWSQSLIPRLHQIPDLLPLFIR